MAPATMPIVLGGGNIGDSTASHATIGSPEVAQELINVFRKYGHSIIDTSRRYPTGASGTSEAYLGQTDIAQWATIDTKVFSDSGDHAPAKIAQSIDESLAALGIPKIRVNYLHFPDRTQKLEDTVTAMNAGLQAGKMEHWGISNYSIDEINEIIEICAKHNYSKPFVYEGQYNALARKAEDELLPLLRKHGIAFYAYSPAAGGAFSKASSRMASNGPIGAMMRGTYGSPALLSAIAAVQSAAEPLHISGHEIALRWVLHHSALSVAHDDAVIVGASSPAQLETTLQACAAGPLPDEIARLVDQTWEAARPEAPDYSPMLAGLDRVGQASAAATKGDEGGVMRDGAAQGEDVAC